MTDSADMAWMETKLTPLPMDIWKTVIRRGNPVAEQIPRTYVACLPHPPGGLIPMVAERMKDDPSWDYRELQASHDPMITDPEVLSDLLLDIVS